MKTNGFVIYRGPSELDGAPIVVIATGYASSSSNAKTGTMIQTWILRADVSPTEAIKSGADESICGDCPHRGIAGRRRTCYVNIGNAPRAVYSAFLRGRYVEAMPDNAGRIVRLGAYGDPAAAPVWVWDRFCAGALAWTGYTHAWRHCAPALQRYCMASCDTVADRDEAKARGWRTFRVSLPQYGDAVKIRGESVCPASKEAGAKLSCSACRACNGTATDRRGDITIQAHGGFGIMANLAALNARLAVNLAA